jgi:hypothetical protein
MAASRFKHLRAAYRSGLEAAIAGVLTCAGVPVQFETLKVPYTQPMKERTYTPDFLLPNGIIIESKGLFSTEDRQKHLWIKAQHPKLDIRFVFSSPSAKLYKGSPTTYADWCSRNGFQYAKKIIPENWLTEPVCPDKVAAVSALSSSSRKRG